MIRVLLLVAQMLGLLDKGVRNISAFAGFFSKLGLFWIVVWGVVIALVVVPKTWWQVRLAEILGWTNTKLQTLVDTIQNGPVQQIDSAFSGLGPIGNYAAYYFDLGFGLQIFAGVLTIWIAVFAIKGLFFLLDKSKAMA
jgi:hypothetical protein